MYEKKYTQEMSKVEVKGFEAQHYDLLMNIITFGTYSFFIKRVIKGLNINRKSLIADFGAGTGKNARLMFKNSGETAIILGFDVGKEMIQKYSKSCNKPNYFLLEAPIDMDFKVSDFSKSNFYYYNNDRKLKKGDINSFFEDFKTFEKYKNRIKFIDFDNKTFSLFNKFDLVFISFVLHGFIHQKREIIIKNAYNLLKPGGRFAILDYNEFDVKHSPFIPRYAITKIECPLAEDFIGRNWEKILSTYNFKDFEKYYYYKKYVRLLISKK